MPTDWTENKLMKCENKENFALFWISQLFDSDFSRKPQKSYAPILFSPTRPSLAGTPAALALHTSPSTIFGSSAPASANTLLYPTHTSGIGLIPGINTQPLGIRHTLVAYMQFSGIGPLPVIYTQPFGTTPRKYM